MKSSDEKIILPRPNSISTSRKHLNSVGKRALKKRLYKKHKKTCVYCLRTINLSEATIDHITPLTKNGTWATHNLQLTCAQCNSEKGAMDHIEFLEYLDNKVT